MRRRSSFLAFTLGLILATVWIGSCTTSQKVHTESWESSEYLGMGVLSREEAAARSRQIFNVTYNLWFDLSRGGDEFDGRTVIFFEMRKPAKDGLRKFHIDFSDGKIRTFNINGVMQGENSPVLKNYDGRRIYLSPEDLQLGMNRLEIAYSHKFGKNGTGLYRYVDPLDNRTYFYSNFEPYSAHEAFPCFDQPNLKASFELTVEVPDEWVVVSNTMERDTTRVDGRKSWAFPPSPKLSTYVLAIHAGQYKEWRREEDEIPLRLFARHSVSEQVRPGEWFPTIAKGLEFFGLQFGYPYPYSKFDMVLVPDTPVYAIESAGAVAMSEEFLYRAMPTRDQFRHRDNQILHDLAHMWFGNLVTPWWWSGLWLNESFASFAAAWAQDEALGDGDAWLSFFHDLKRWAYLEDQKSTTHPVDVAVMNTDEARANFDGVTYGKGASILKQLQFFLGDDDFREGMQRYFQAFSIRNANLTEFLKVLGQAAGKDLTSWRKEWFQTVGVNTVQVKWSCMTPPMPTEEELAALTPRVRRKKMEPKEPEIDHMSIRQEAIQGGAGLMAHKMRLGFFSESDSPRSPQAKLKPFEIFDLAYSGAETVAAKAVGLPCPDYVIPNWDDLDYIKPVLDPKTEKWVRENLHRIDDPVMRAALWHRLWEQVLDGSLSPREYGELSLKYLKAETKTEIIDTALETLGDYSLASNTVLKFLSGKERAEFRSELEKFLRGKVLGLPASDVQKVFFKQLLHIAGEPESFRMIEALYTGKSRLQGRTAKFKTDPDMRGLILLALARGNSEKMDSWLSEEKNADSSLHGERFVRQAEVQLPRELTKKLWWSRLVREKSELDYPRLEELLEFFHVVGQEELSRGFVDSYFEALSQMNRRGEEESYFADAASELFPHLCDSSVVGRVSQMLAKSRFPASVTLALNSAREEEERCIRIRKKWTVPEPVKAEPVVAPSVVPSPAPSVAPSAVPSPAPSPVVSPAPSATPSAVPSVFPSVIGPI